VELFELLLRYLVLALAEISIVLSEEISLLLLCAHQAVPLGLLMDLLVPVLAHDGIGLVLSLPAFRVRRLRLIRGHSVRAIPVGLWRVVPGRSLLQSTVQILFLFFIWRGKCSGETLS